MALPWLDVTVWDDNLCVSFDVEDWGSIPVSMTMRCCVSALRVSQKDVGIISDL